MPDQSIVVINTGSSSLKYGLYVDQNGEEKLQFGGSAQNGTIELKDFVSLLARIFLFPLEDFFH